MINLQTLDFHLSNFEESNRCFNDEEKFGILYGMTTLEEHINKEIYLWGKIEGLEYDYYITYYFNQENFFPKKKFYYCRNDYVFHEMLKGNDDFIENIERKLPFTFFSGYPQRIFYSKDKTKGLKKKVTDGGDSNDDSDDNENNDSDDNENNDSDDCDNNNSDDHSNDGDDKIKSPSYTTKEKKKSQRKNLYNDKNTDIKKKKYEKQNITELDRLSYTVRKIDEEAFIIPYNSIRITNNLEMKFCNFSGFNILDALKLTSWVHFRYPKNLTYDKIKNYNSFFLNNFLDSIKSDIPSNIWNIKINKQLNKISILNALYPGYIFYHMLNTPFYASLYIGTGVSNYDLPFLLP
ncbi:hypothetical protein PGSY75_1215800 [Plasmodium gaboni]|uniref:Radial spoke head protein 9 homolog n=1 Tax=Plasmodium gaboni TaxID=647221 RepID=A0A151LGH6_9APIC|nr:hypothetical protein PGSY75_1215800 [Plasmodium gaboni]KYN97969.1 hypothetical protein PGSY75_1215800 [Plasmodium gaboni]